MAKKKRLDILLVERDLIESRSKAAARIMAGDVFVKGQRCTKKMFRLNSRAMRSLTSLAVVSNLKPSSMPSLLIAPI